MNIALAPLNHFTGMTKRVSQPACRAFNQPIQDIFFRGTGVQELSNGAIVGGIKFEVTFSKKGLLNVAQIGNVKIEFGDNGTDTITLPTLPTLPKTKKRGQQKQQQVSITNNGESVGITGENVMIRPDKEGQVLEIPGFGKITIINDHGARKYKISPEGKKEASLQVSKNFITFEVFEGKTKTAYVKEKEGEKYKETSDFVLPNIMEGNWKKWETFYNNKLIE